jgi:hypothetical protein
VAETHASPCVHCADAVQVCLALWRLTARETWSLMMTRTSRSPLTPPRAGNAMGAPLTCQVSKAHGCAVFMACTWRVHGMAARRASGAKGPQLPCQVFKAHGCAASQCVHGMYRVRTWHVHGMTAGRVGSTKGARLTCQAGKAHGCVVFMACTGCVHGGCVHVTACQTGPER